MTCFTSVLPCLRNCIATHLILPQVVGVRAPPLRSMRLGLLPLRDPHAPRSINIIKQPGHEVWTKTTGPELRDFLQVRGDRRTTADC